MLKLYSVNCVVKFNSFNLDNKMTTHFTILSSFAYSMHFWRWLKVFKLFFLYSIFISAGKLLSKSCTVPYMLFLFYIVVVSLSFLGLVN